VVPRVPGYDVPFAERIHRETDVPTMAVAERYLREGRCDLIGLARQMCGTPIGRAAEVLGAKLLTLLPSYA
jgi:2,4-dienoyl-CoA reductase-like NADH-dependent reductase (Old Yellow Enzyme family)